MVGWRHRLNGHEFEQTPGAGRGQASLVYCSPWSHRESDATERLNNNNRSLLKEKSSHSGNKDHGKQEEGGFERPLEGGAGGQALAALCPLHLKIPLPSPSRLQRP